MEVPALVSKDAGQSAARLIDEMSRLCFLSRAIYVAADLGVADQLGEEPLGSADLAEKTGTNASALGRLLMFLAAYEIFQQMPDGKFSHTPLSAVLREDHPNSMRPGIRRFVSQWWSAVGELEHSIQTGESAFEKIYGVSIFQYLKGNVELQQRFDVGMSRVSDADDAAIAAAYDFKKFGHIVDVGGGQGGLLTQILLVAPESMGILFDQPQVIERATRLSESGLSDRSELVEGSFFESVPRGADCYVIKGVLHDFNDDQCVSILSNCREAMDANGRVVIANQDLPSPIDGPHPNLTLDMNMMAVLNGRERSQNDWSELLRRSGLDLSDAYQTDSLFTLIDSVPI
jgi:hypothetical protein